MLAHTYVQLELRESAISLLFKQSAATDVEEFRIALVCCALNVCAGSNSCLWDGHPVIGFVNKKNRLIDSFVSQVPRELLRGQEKRKSIQELYEVIFC